MCMYEAATQIPKPLHICMYVHILYGCNISVYQESCGTDACIVCGRV